MRVERRVAKGCLCEAPASSTFQRECRLTQKQEYDRVLKSRASIRVSCGCFKVIAVERNEGTARLGLIVGKRQLRSAVDRNRFKRMVRESFRVSRSTLPGLDVVFQLVGIPDRRFARDVASVWGGLRDRFERARDVG